MSATRGRPAVSVPVLSTSRVRARPRTSSEPPSRTSTPRRATRDNPETMAIGVASSNGHGVATTSTATARRKSPESTQPSPASASVNGTKAAAYRSASRTVGALRAVASSASRTMPAYVLRSALSAARNPNAGPAFTTPLATRAPAARSTSRDSPVTTDSSSVEALSVTPSTRPRHPDRPATGHRPPPGPPVPPRPRPRRFAAVRYGAPAPAAPADHGSPDAARTPPASARWPASPRPPRRPGTRRRQVRRPTPARRSHPRRTAAAAGPARPVVPPHRPAPAA